MIKRLLPNLAHVDIHTWDDILFGAGMRQENFTGKRMTMTVGVSAKITGGSYAR